MIFRLATLCIVFLLCSAVSSIAHPDTPPLPIDEAWGAWEQGDHEGIEKKFLEAISATPEDARAYVGLSYLYALQRRYDAAWSAYAKALKYLPGREAAHAYLYAAWYSPELEAALSGRDSTTLAMLEDLAINGDATGILKGMANQRLGRYYLYRNQSEKASEYYRNVHAIQDWRVMGPFDNISASGHEKQFPPEMEYKADAQYEGKNGVQARWFPLSVHRRDNWIDFNRYFASSSSVYYANTFVYSPQKRVVQVRTGTSGSFKVFLNDELVSEESEEYDNDLDTYIAETELQKGWNRVLVKCGSSEIQACNFLLRITDQHGAPLEGLRTSTEPQRYKSGPGSQVRRMNHFAEEFFRSQMAAHPERLENYLLLADTYLRNDKAIDAELTIREAIRRMPGSPLFYEHMAAAYNSGDKTDEASRALDKIYALDREAPSGLEHKFYQFIQTEQLEQASEVMQQYERIRPESAELYQMRIAICQQKEELEKLIELSRQAYERFPMNPAFIRAHAMLVAQSTQRAQSAITIYKKYLRERADEEMLVELASFYQNQSDIKNWRKVYDQLLELDPASPGYLYEMAGVYYEMRNYTSAEEILRRALEICPNSSSAWARLAEVQRAGSKESDAIASYRAALEFDPTNYDARAALRDLLGKRPAFSQFEPVDTDSILGYGRRMLGNPEDGAVVLLNHAQYVVYEKGASESMKEIIAKMTSKRGIDAWKEYEIPYNSYNEELIIDKAAAVKADGSEVNADVSDNYVVFKSLQEGDVIHLKWHAKNHYSGKLSNHFFDSYYFNGFYPTQHVRYELLAPPGFKFHHATQNMSAPMTTAAAEDGTIYRWTKEDLPAISYEYGMPTIDDAGSILHISSIDSWEYMVEWYRDIATTKARPSYEIREQVEELMDGENNLSDEEKMGRIYNFITENIRYSSVGFRQGAHIPQKARDVLVNKIGDCKDVAALCIAMLREAGMHANYVLVNTRDAGLNAEVLPSIAFNHCIVAVETPKGERYLDLTASNFPIGSIPSGDLEAFALVIKPGVTAPIYLPKEGTMPRTMTVRSSVEMLKDHGIAGRQTTLATGAMAAAMRDAFRDQPRKEQEKMLLPSLSAAYPNISLSGLSIEKLDTIAPEMSYSYEYQLPEYATEAGEFIIFSIPWMSKEDTDEGLSYQEREHPYIYWTGTDTLTEEIGIALPQGYEPVAVPAPLELRSPVAEYSVRYEYTAGKLNAYRQIITRKNLVQPEEYVEFRKFHNRIVKEDGRQLLLRPTAN